MKETQSEVQCDLYIWVQYIILQALLGPYIQTDALSSVTINIQNLYII